MSKPQIWLINRISAYDGTAHHTETVHYLSRYLHIPSVLLHAFTCSAYFLKLTHLAQRLELKWRRKGWVCIFSGHE